MVTHESYGVRRLIFIQFIRSTWVDDLSKTSQNKKLGNVYISYADFLAFDLFPLLRDSETFVLLSYGQIKILKTRIGVVDSFLPLL